MADGSPLRSGRSMKNPRLLLAGTLAFAAAGPAPALTIGEAFHEASRSNPTLYAAREAARAQHEGVPLALSAWLPTLNASWMQTETHTRQDLRCTVSDPAFQAFQNCGPSQSRSDRTTLELSLNQNLYRGGQDAARLRQADEEVLRSHASLRDVEQTVFLQVATAYLDLIRAERVVVLRKASLASFEARYHDTKSQYEIGDRTQADLAQAEAEKQIAAADVISAQATLDSLRARFEELVGRPPGALTTPPEPPGLPPTLEEAQRSAQHDLPTVRAARHALSAAGHAEDAAAGQLGPTLDLTGSIQQYDSFSKSNTDDYVRVNSVPSLTVDADNPRRHGFDTPNHIHTLPRLLDPPQTVSDIGRSTDIDGNIRQVSLRLNVPLYLGGRVGAQLRQAQHREEQMRGRLVAAKRQAIQSATAAWQELHAARYRKQATAAAVDASKVALDGIVREAAIGERTVREVLDAERAYVSRQVQARGAERDVIVQAYTLLRATGRLTAERLAISGLPDLAEEAEAARWNLLPGVVDLVDRPEAPAE